MGVGEPLLLCKQQVKEGKRTEWSVKRAPQQPPTSANGAATANSVGLVPTQGVSQVGPRRATEITAGEPQTVALAREEGAGNGGTQPEGQPSGNSRAPLAPQLALQH